MSKSYEIAKEMEKLFPGQCKIVKIKMKHVKEVRAYIRKIEEAHKKAANSNLVFR